jgi:hypothetical protein
MVAGGVGLDANGQPVPVNSAETLTLGWNNGAPTGSWFQETALPNSITGRKLRSLKSVAKMEMKMDVAKMGWERQ